MGLGPGDPLSLPPRAFALLTGALPVLLRTERHPCLAEGPLADALAALPPGRVVALDDEYEAGASFADTYAAIVERVLRAHDTRGDLVYAVPGHPLVGESTVALLLERAAARQVPVRVTGAPSFVDACLETLGVAVTADLHVVDALALDPADPAPHAALRSGGPVLLYQVHSREAASDAKLALMRAGYPDDFAVAVVRAAGIPGIESRETLPLYELDRRDHDHLTSVWVPALPPDLRRGDFDALLRIMARLRDPERGCPWDREQTHASLRRYLIEETYEVAEAIDRDDPDALCEELGDLLLQVVFHARLGAEEGLFDAGDVCAAICEKLVRRHPHIFGDEVADDSEAVLTRWNAIKAQEKAARGEAPARSVLDGVPTSLPALALALETSRRVVKQGFEWPDVAAVFDKAAEEVAELRAEIAADAAPQRIADELGDVLFTLVNVGRKVGVDAEEALRRQVSRFSTRWRFVEEQAAASGRAVGELTAAEQTALWRRAKEAERRTKE